MYKGTCYLEKGFVVIVIPEGKTMMIDGAEVPALNWTCSIPVTDVESLKEYLTDEQINGLN